MSQQGGRPTGHGDDWWRRLYDDSTDDTGPTPAPDSLDDRFASASGAVGDGPEGRSGSAAGPVKRPSGAEPVVPAPRAGADDMMDALRPDDLPPRRAPWEPPPARPPGPVSFPTAAEPPGRPADRSPSDEHPGGAASPTGPGTPSDERPGDANAPAGPRTPSARVERPPASTFPASRTPPAPPPPADPPATAAGTPAGPTPPAVAPPPDEAASAPPEAGHGALPAAEPGSTAHPATTAWPPVPPRPGAAPSSSPDQPPVPPRPAEPPSAASRPTDPPSAPPRPAEPPPGARQPAGVPPEAYRPAEPPPAAQRPADPSPDARRPAGSPATDRRAEPPPPRPSSPPAPTPATDRPGPRIERPVPTPGSRGHVGTRPPTYDAEPTALPAADPDDLDDLVADTVLDGARYGACTLRAVSVRGDSARYRGEPRRDALLTARFGAGEQALLLVAMATGARATRGAHRAAAEACHWIGRAVGRSHARLVEDIRDGRRGDLKSGLHRLTDRSLGKLRASASEQGVDPEEYAAGLRCLLLPADPACRTRVFFGVGPGGLFRLREGEWQDIEPQVAEVKGEPVVGFGSPPSETPEGDRLTMDLGIPTPPSPYEPAPEPPREPFRFRTSVARPGDTLLMCSGGLAEPLRGEPELGEYLAERWSRPEPPGLAAFLADSQVRVKGYADDRTAAAVWEA
ncbi:protein phosphatase 2C domain-containing protein [Streptomyces sp. NPDC012466]|uniref:protein phosphatase 2C domain-containing protein n=1 Tax=Streptomyces sp. NPDC012466 TaxID=3364835 RepID=UPI0036E33997